MYDELVKRMREAKAVVFKTEDVALLCEAADAIEELQKRVPKRPHGRLIDADALEALFWDGQCYFTENIKYKIKNIETIIPADEG